MVRVTGGLRYFKANFVSGRGHHKCKHSVNPTNYMYSDKLCLSLSVLFASDHMINLCRYLGLWKCMQLYDKMFFYSSLTFLLVVCSLCVVFSFCDDHQFIDGSRCENSSWSSGSWRLRSLALSWISLSKFLLGL